MKKFPEDNEVGRFNIVLPSFALTVTLSGHGGSKGWSNYFQLNDFLERADI